MALALSTAKQLSRGKKQGKVISEYEGKASPRRSKSSNGASNRFRPASKKR